VSKEKLDFRVNQDDISSGSYNTTKKSSSLYAGLLSDLTESIGHLDLCRPACELCAWCKDYSRSAERLVPSTIH
jgi:hypothetical protein